MRVLVDLDGVLADWGHAYGQSLDAFGMAAMSIPRHGEQRSFDLNEGRTDAEKAIIAQVMVEPGFYAKLRPIAGAKEALKRLVKDGHDVRIVTSPWASNPTCASDKLNWIIENYGSHWAKRVIITSDKTLVRGDILVDDKPVITGSMEPEWVHVRFTQPYNYLIAGPRLHDWSAESVDQLIHRFQAVTV